MRLFLALTTSAPSAPVLPRLHPPVPLNLSLLGNYPIVLSNTQQHDLTHRLSADWPAVPHLMAWPVLLQERMVYLSHIYQLAASARSVVAENKLLRLRLEASKKGSATLVRSAP